MNEAKYEMISVSEMKVDTSYQRVADEKRVKKIAEEWDDMKANIIHISRRKDGDYVMDGNHTRLAYKSIGGDRLLCRIHEGLSIAEEAKFFFEINISHKKPRYGEILKAKAEAGCELEKTYIQCLDESGVSYSLSAHHGGYVRCHAALMKIYKLTTYHLMLRALTTANRAVDGRPEFYQTGYFPGLVSLIILHPEIDDRRLVQKVKRTTAARVNEVADIYKRGIVIGGTSSATKSFRKAYIDIYNKALKANRITE